MPTPVFSTADLLNGGLIHPAITKAIKLDPQREPDSDATLKSYKKAAGLAVRVSALGKLADVIRRASNPLSLATSLITAKHAALGGDGGFLGSATTAVTVCPDGRGYYRHFRGGSIYWHPFTGAHEVHGAIRGKWSSLGWERSFLGYPTTDETAGRELQGQGRYNHFQGGSIYWHPATGAHEVHGAIRVKYLELGAESSFLGYPTTDETTTPDKIGRFNHFQAGSIYWTPSTWAHEVHGLIRQLWSQGGWERNPELGYPVTDELIPDRFIGHSVPTFTRKPQMHIPADLIRLPEAATTPGLAVAAPPASAAASAAATAAALPAARTPVTAVRSAAIAPVARAAIGVTPRPAAATFTSATAVAHIRPDLLGAIVAATPAGVSQGAREGGTSRNRFTDFENGLLFWRRGSTTAEKLTPWLHTAAGQKLHLTAAEVAAVASTTIRGVLSHLGSLTVAGINFIGTTPYWFDGAATQNRRHRLQVVLQGMQMAGIIPVPLTAILEIQALVALDPVGRQVAGHLTQWRLLSAGGQVKGEPLDRQLHRLLDPTLWVKFQLLPIPLQDGVPLPVLSVKTMPDGEVHIFVEP